MQHTDEIYTRKRDKTRSRAAKLEAQRRREIRKDKYGKVAR